MYSCGPTVYSKQHIGNLKAPIFADLVARTLTEAGYRVRRVINITDVGHLVGDGNAGEDKMEVGARTEKRGVRDIAERYTRMFLDDIHALNLDTERIKFPRATEYIKEQIAMVEELERRGFTYRISDGIYFDTSLFPDYGQLGGVREQLRSGVGESRIGENEEKKNAADFALWKFSPKNEHRLQEWGSPWGPGFPGWHIECSAMAKALLGETIDIHTGGIDHIPVHHNNEIAQSQNANGKPLARYWMHEAFVNLGEEKIAKSVGNVIYLSEIIERGYHPLALRYFFLQAHYRTPVSFTWEALAASHEALERLWRLCLRTRTESGGRGKPSDQSRRIIAHFRDDLATPQALALLWESLKDEDLDASEVWGVIEAAETVLGLSLTYPPIAPTVTTELPDDIQKLLYERDLARNARDFGRSDELRIHIENRGYRVEDGPSGTVVTKHPG